MSPAGGQNWQQYVDHYDHYEEYTNIKDRWKQLCYF